VEESGEERLRSILFGQYYKRVKASKALSLGSNISTFHHQKSKKLYRCLELVFLCRLKKKNSGVEVHFFEIFGGEAKTLTSNISETVTDTDTKLYLPVPYMGPSLCLTAQGRQVKGPPKNLGVPFLGPPYQTV
jgi:hypothetical protein